jgi:predicted nucleic acid-binding protein
MWMVDSTLFIDWMRRRRNPTAILRPYVLLGRIATCGVIRVEVLRGMVKPAAKAETENLLGALIDIPFAAPVWNRIAEIAWSLDRKGAILPTSDLMIAGCALHVGATVVTYDNHFAEIPGLPVIKRLPELPSTLA